ERVKEINKEGKRQGGVIWHTQGSGKSLTMVMMAKALSLESSISDPRIILVTDRVDIDDQIYKTFHQCGKDPVQATSGEDLVTKIKEKKEIITTIVDKFETAGKKRKFKDTSNNIFVLVDESHRSHYGVANATMEKVLPNACYIGFTGTPLMKKDKNTAIKFGGIIDTYTIDRAVQDKAVVPLLYEGRHVVQEVNQTSIDSWFEKISKNLTEKQKTDLKRKFSTADQLNEAEQKIARAAYDISEHFKNTWKDTPFKGQLTAPSKIAALKYKKYLDDFGEVSSEILISGPDTREGHEDVFEETKSEVQIFWKNMMNKYGNEKNYNKQVINSFKNDDCPEVIIVVDKLLTGFDAPRNVVLYITRNLRDHKLLQAIARVNRLYENKEFGYIIDYYGLLGNLDKALADYTSLEDFDNEDIEGLLKNITEEINTLPQKHSDLREIFKEIKNKSDEEAYEQLLSDEELRDNFYERLTDYAKTLSIAMSSSKYLEETPDDKINNYKKDLQFFLSLRKSVKKRYSDEIDYRDYEPKIRKLIDTYIPSDEVLQVTEPINIFESEKFQAQVEECKTIASQADTIAYRTEKTIEEKLEEDPVFYTRFS
ncbi:MAG: HsdR family type I site-specific deoxyribonuclease, partial [Candidatus Eremiobacterota bacterium]